MAVTGWEFTFKFYENESDLVGVTMKDIVEVENLNEAKTILNEIWLDQTPSVLSDGTKVSPAPPTAGQSIIIQEDKIKRIIDGKFESDS